MSMCSLSRSHRIFVSFAVVRPFVFREDTLMSVESPEPELQNVTSNEPWVYGA